MNNNNWTGTILVRLKDKTFAFVFLCLFSIIALANAEVKWTTNEITLGSMNLDGQLHKEIQLGTLKGPVEFEFPITLLHTIDQIGVSSVKGSVWSIPQLKTYVVPQGRVHLYWLHPGGEATLFDIKSIGKEFSRAGSSEWLARSPSDDVYEFMDGDKSAVYRYENGKIKSLRAVASERALLFENQEGLIVRIVSEPLDQTLLEVNLNKKGQVAEIAIGPDHHRFDYNALTNQIVTWNRNNISKPVVFSYDPQEFVIARITYENGSMENFSWETRQVKDKEKKTIARHVLLNDKDSTYRFQEVTKEGIVLSRADRLGRNEVLKYNPRSGKVVHTNFEGSKSTFDYKMSQHTNELKIQETRDANGQIRKKFFYDEAGKVIAISEKGKPRLTYHYDSQGRLIAVHRGNDKLQSFKYQGNLPNPSEVTDVFGNTVHFSYDHKGQALYMKDLNGGEHHFQYNLFGRVTKHELPLGYGKEVVYDQYQRIIQNKEADNSVTKIIFDSLFNRVSEVTEDKHHWEYHYDSVGRLRELVKDKERWVNWEFVDNNVGEDDRFEGMADGASRAVIETGPQGSEASKIFDVNDNLIAERNALGETIHYQYDRGSQLKGWRDAKGGDFIFERDLMGRISKQINPLGDTLQWKYDNLGRVREKQNGEQTICYVWDDETGEIKTVDYGDGQVVKFDRNKEGKIIKASAGEVVSEFAYDKLGRVIATKQTLPDGTVDGLMYQYAASGAKKAVGIWKKGTNSSSSMRTISFKSNPMASEGDISQTTEYEYDKLGRVALVKVDGKEEMAYRYNKETLKPEAKLFANGLVVRYFHDEEGHIASMSAFQGKRRREFTSVALEDLRGEPLYEVQYDWNKYGQLEKRIIRDEAGVIEQGYTYDSLGRVKYIRSPKRPDLDEYYNYDANGNVIEGKTGGKIFKMEYDNANQLVRRMGSDGVGEFAYDKAGRMVRETWGGSEVTSYTYGYLDRVTHLNRNGQDVNFHYNASGMLVGKSKAGETESWLWDGLALAARGDETFANENHASGGIPVLSKNLVTQDEHFMLNDYLGTTLCLIKNSGDSSRVMLTSYGSDPHTPNGFSAAPLQGIGDAAKKLSGVEGDGRTDKYRSARFTGKPYDADLKAHIFPFRNYRADLVRWTSADPSGFPDGPNQYFYAPVPTNGLDPLGLNTCDATYLTTFYVAPEESLTLVYTLKYSAHAQPELVGTPRIEGIGKSFNGPMGWNVDIVDPTLTNITSSGSCDPQTGGTVVYTGYLAATVTLEVAIGIKLGSFFTIGFPYKTSIPILEHWEVRVE